MLEMPRKTLKYQSLFLGNIFAQRVCHMNIFEENQFVASLSKRVYQLIVEPKFRRSMK